MKKTITLQAQLVEEVHTTHYAENGVCDKIRLTLETKKDKEYKTKWYNINGTNYDYRELYNKHRDIVQHVRNIEVYIENYTADMPNSQLKAKVGLPLNISFTIDTKDNHITKRNIGKNATIQAFEGQTNYN